MNAAVPTAGMTASWDIPVGAPVVDCAGEPLGRVVEADVSDIHVRRGWFFMPTIAIPLGHVARYEDGTLWLDITRAELTRRD